MERNAGYEIKRLLLYDDNKGFALGENLRAPDPYVTWKVTEEQGRRSFDWGHYFTTERAAVKDFLKRAGDYEKENSVFLASEGPQPDSFKYYSTQRPIDIGTFPKGGGNDPIRFQNYDKRLPVEGGAFLAWGELEYGKQLTDDELFCYELRPSRDNPDVWRRMDALAQAGVKYGLPKGVALKVASQAVLGTTRLLQESGEHPRALADQVCSPGGTTIEGVCALQREGFEAAVQAAVDASLEKDRRL